MRFRNFAFIGSNKVFDSEFLILKEAEMTAKKTKSKLARPSGRKSAKAKKGNSSKKKANTSKKKHSKNKSTKLRKPVAKKSISKTKKGPTKTNSKKAKVVSVVLKAKKIKEVVKPIVTETLKKERKSNKQPAYLPPPLPKIEVSNWQKNKVKSILISQPQPESEKNPYFDLGKKYSLNLHFRQFIKVEGLSSMDFRLQRIEILAHHAVILTSKLSVDHYFRMCNEMRVTVPETMKYFCINEQTAYYLQKYIQYRKRKIFFGHGTISDLVDVIKKNRDEKFLLPVSDVHKEQIVEFLDELKITYSKGIFYRTVSADLADITNLNEFDALVFFTPAGIKSLKQNFPSFKQNNTRIAAFGHATAQMVKQLGFRLDIFAPNPVNPSMTGAIDCYIKEANKR